MLCLSLILQPTHFQSLGTYGNYEEPNQTAVANMKQQNAALFEGPASSDDLSFVGRARIYDVQVTTRIQMVFISTSRWWKRKFGLT